MTVKLYENNSLLKSCQSVVTACAESNGKYFVELDQTAKGQEVRSRHPV